MVNKTFERLAIMLMMAILMSLLFCAYLLVQLSKIHPKNGEVTHYNQSDDGVSQLQNNWKIVIDTTAPITQSYNKSASIAP